ncbi:MAG TPA: PKD domain-containing protein [Solirubrobacteraceae bacterium]|nr:PKD domain-containing protein [Solirubrobacteraceae bacterium]
MKIVRRPHRRVLAALGAALALLLALAVPQAAAAAPTSFVEIGPLKLGHFTATLFVNGCRGANSGTLSLDRGTRRALEDYSYTGPVNCVANGLTGAKLSFDWAALGSGSLKVSHLGRVRRDQLPAGCHGARGNGRPVRLSGHLNLTPARALGRLSQRSVGGFLGRTGRFSCAVPRAPRAVNFSAGFGPRTFMFATKPARGLRTVFLSENFAPAQGITGVFSVNESGGPRLFALTRHGARIGDLGPLARGGLTITSLPVCTGANRAAHNTSLSGMITVKAPVLGTVSFSPGSATNAFLARGSALPGQCNGYGSVPLTPKVDNSCSTQGLCAVSDGTNADTFYDLSNPGTQHVISETINFGDGTTGTFTNGQVAHTYAQAGTYTATVTITTDNGQTQTTTTPVYIGA